MSETRGTADNGLVVFAWKAVAVVVLRGLALAACAVVIARLLPESGGASDAGEGAVPLWVSVGLMIGLFTVVLVAWRPVEDFWPVSLAEMVVAAGLLAAAWLVGEESEVISQAVPLLASVWMAFAAVDVARAVRRT